MLPIGHKHLTLIKYKKGENTYKVHCVEKNTYKHNILLTLQNKSRLFIDNEKKWCKKLGRMQDWTRVSRESV